MEAGYLPKPDSVFHKKMLPSHNSSMPAPFSVGMEELSFTGPAVFRGKKIALVVNAAWNFWNFRRALIQALLQRGCEVVLIAPEDDYRPMLQAAFPEVAFVSLKKLSRKSLSVWGNSRTYLELKAVLAQERPDCAVFYTIKPNIFGSFAVRALSIPAIAVVTGVGYAGTAPLPIRYLVFWLYRQAFRFVQKAVFQNYDDRREFLLAEALTPEKATVIKGSGIDTRYYAPAARPSNQAPIFIFVGRFLSEKGIREFVKAVAQVRRGAPGTRFQILGSPDPGNPASILPAELQSWISEGLVEYLGQVEDVRPFVQRADVLVLPSYYREGMPRALLEGMAMGLPIITTDSVGCRDTVEDGRNGFIVPAGDTSALAAAMLRFAHLPDPGKQAMGHYSREKAIREFCNEVILPRYLSLIGEALQTAPYTPRPPAPAKTA